MKAVLLLALVGFAALVAADEVKRYQLKEMAIGQRKDQRPLAQFLQSIRPSRSVSTLCPNGVYCPEGTTCCPNGCCDAPSAVCCGTGWCCSEGYECCTEEGCCPIGSNCCGDFCCEDNGKCCGHGCCSEGASCCPMTNGRMGCCPVSGAVCCADNTCCSGENCCS